jgi:4-hydroxybenzoate polyprenyltransferase
MIPFLKLIRFQNLLIVVATQYLMRLCIVEPILEVNHFELKFSDLNFFFLVLATVMITAAGYVINDYFDRKTDLLNRPGTVIVGTFINRRAAIIWHVIFNVIGIGLGFYISFKIGLYQLGFIFVIVTGVLWYYSTTYKRQFLIGNLIVSILTALVPFMVVLYEIPTLNESYRATLLLRNINFNNIFIWVAGFSFFAFLSTLIREIVKDIEDFEGDNAYGRNTLPIVLGIFYSKVVVISLTVITIAALCFVYFIYLNDNITFWYFLIALIIPFLFLIYKIVHANTKVDYHFASNFTKFIMFGGLLYSLVAYYIFSNVFNL